MQEPQHDAALNALQHITSALADYVLDARTAAIALTGAQSQGNRAGRQTPRRHRSRPPVAVVAGGDLCADQERSAGAGNAAPVERAR
jgi:hypothetical protein